MKKLLTLAATGLIGFTSVNAEEGELLSIAEVAAYTPESFSTLTAALVTTDLAKTLNSEGAFTIFAPTNAAFDTAAKALLGDESATGLDLLLALDKETLAEILTYHVLPGALLSDDVLASDTFTTVNGADVNRVDTTIVGGQGSSGNLVLELINLEAANGIIHVIDGVLLPPIVEEPVSILETALNTPALSSLVAAVQKANLGWILGSERFNLTVFAPTNDAFDAAARAALGDENATGADLVEALPAWKLRRILLNHILFGDLDSGDVLSKDRYYTLIWSKLTREDLTLFSRNGQGTLIPELIDIEATNGIVHVIDGVLLP
ncbi:fasciclin domain-containing protein [Puniceicoccales bacterium CK1056]|uniref:Fasciclin domain-containing protein n=1 Tax=Oceanipulchritudo coccoides TaxID=2706888 RepID=A0A6B2M1Q1_9BACT|nr:fasciclin domain-containing protein [Oceanipulchritudo coccoides]NDV62858.1 fasciclin domain-containing protein [Oceanipulchritudo coccoides]